MQHIVVGTDGSEGADAALRWAVAEARTWGATLEVVLAWSYLDQHTAEFDPDYGENDARAELDSALERVGPTDDIEVVRTVVNDLPGHALDAAAEHSDLVVVGSRGLGSVKAKVLGSVSQHVIAKSPADVVIIRPRTGRS